MIDIREHGGAFGGGKKKPFSTHYSELGFTTPPIEFQLGVELLYVHTIDVADDGKKVAIGDSQHVIWKFDQNRKLVSKSGSVGASPYPLVYVKDDIVVYFMGSSTKILKYLKPDGTHVTLLSNIATNTGQLFSSLDKSEFIFFDVNYRLYHFAVIDGVPTQVKFVTTITNVYNVAPLRDGGFVAARRDFALQHLDKDLAILKTKPSGGGLWPAHHILTAVNEVLGLVVVLSSDSRVFVLKLSDFSLVSSFPVVGAAQNNYGRGGLHFDKKGKIHVIGESTYSIYNLQGVEEASTRLNIALYASEGRDVDGGFLFYMNTANGTAGKYRIYI